MLVAAVRVLLDTVLYPLLGLWHQSAVLNFGAHTFAAIRRGKHPCLSTANTGATLEQALGNWEESDEAGGDVDGPHSDTLRV